jgi:hypothetical protein
MRTVDRLGGKVVILPCGLKFMGLFDADLIEN